MMRTYRLHQVVCASANHSSCTPNPGLVDMFEIVRADVTKRRVCTGIMAARGQDLFYQPIAVDLSAPDG